MEMFKDPKIDWLGLKWIFIGLSCFLALAGLISVYVQGGLNYGVDFTGGSLIYVKFKGTPDLGKIRRGLSGAGFNNPEVTRFDDPAKNEVQIKLGEIESEEKVDLGTLGDKVEAALQVTFGGAGQKIDLNNVSASNLAQALQAADPEKLREKLSLSEVSDHYRALAKQLIDFKNSQGGILKDASELTSLSLPEADVNWLRGNATFGDFTRLGVESVGPKVGQELRERAKWAVTLSLLGMLVYITVRFQLIYGFAAIVALFHDVLITVGFLSLTHREMSLTVIAALLTLVGYSLNDTIVVFDRVRENLMLMRRSDLGTIMNRSINQTLNRTITTSGMTFLAVLSLYMLGGPALNAFSFALVVGIIIGTYSSIAIASPIVLWWQNGMSRRKGRKKK